MKYQIRLSEFHGGGLGYNGKLMAWKKALASIGCGDDCQCGGGSIETEDGTAVLLERLPDECLLGQREPTQEEIDQMA
jgi:hypothetical protein